MGGDPTLGRANLKSPTPPRLKIFSAAAGCLLHYWQNYKKARAHTQTVVVITTHKDDTFKLVCNISIVFIDYRNRQWSSNGTGESETLAPEKYLAPTMARGI